MHLRSYPIPVLLPSTRPPLHTRWTIRIQAVDPEPHPDLGRSASTALQLIEDRALPLLNQ